MKKKRTPVLGSLVFLMLAALALGTCGGWENEADLEAIEKSQAAEFVSPGAAVAIDFRPVAAYACCYVYRSDNESQTRPPSLLLDKKESTSHDWGWQGNSAWNRSDFFIPADSIIGANCKVGHTTGHTNALNEKAHFYTFDLGAVKSNIWRIGLMANGVNKFPEEYEIWISDDIKMGVDPATEGATLALSGTWTQTNDSDRWRFADFTGEDCTITGPVNARYIQIRSVSTHAAANADYELSAAEVRVDIFGAFSGDAIDLVPLQTAYAKGAQLLKTTKVLSFIPQLEKLLYGEFNRSGELVTKGATQLLGEAVEKSSEPLAEKALFQQVCNDKAEEIAVVCRVLLQGL